MVVTAGGQSGPVHFRTMMMAGEPGGAGVLGRGQSRTGPAALAGTWNWVSGQVLVVHSDGTFEVYKDGGRINDGHWVNLQGWQYRLNHRNGGYIDTVTLSADGNALDGTNNLGYQLHGSRQ